MIFCYYQVLPSNRKIAFTVYLIRSNTNFMRSVSRRSSWQMKQLTIQWQTDRDTCLMQRGLRQGNGLEGCLQKGGAESGEAGRLPSCSLWGRRISALCWNPIHSLGSSAPRRSGAQFQNPLPCLWPFCKPQWKCLDNWSSTLPCCSHTSSAPLCPALVRQPRGDAGGAAATRINSDQCFTSSSAHGRLAWSETANGPDVNRMIRVQF